MVEKEEWLAWFERERENYMAQPGELAKANPEFGPVRGTSRV